MIKLNFVMAHKRKGQLTVSGEWAKHLRRYWSRKFWKAERKAGKKQINQEMDSTHADSFSAVQYSN
jgi:hypothetical protein